MSEERPEIEFMSTEQEKVMRNLYDFGIQLNDARTFAINADKSTLECILTEITKLEDIYRKLDDILPEDAEIEQEQSYIDQQNLVFNAYSSSIIN